MTNVELLRWANAKADGAGIDVWVTSEEFYELVPYQTGIPARDESIKGHPFRRYKLSEFRRIRERIAQRIADEVVEALHV